jgi:hypothetical protein
MNCAIVRVAESAAIAFAIANVFIAPPSRFSGCCLKAYRTKAKLWQPLQRKDEFLA